jgi:predicted permease
MTTIAYVLRTLTRHRGFTFAALMTISLSSGITASVVAIADAVLFRPLDAPALARLVVVRQDVKSFNLEDASLDAPGAKDLIDRRDVFEVAAGHEAIAFNLDDAGLDPQRVVAARTLGEFFSVMGVGAEAGRLYESGASTTDARIAVLSHGLWRQRFRGDPAIVGRTIALSGVPYRVVGVAGPSATYPRDAQLFIPYPVDSTFERGRGRRFTMTVVGRVKEGISPAQLAQQLHRQADIWSEQRGNGPMSSSRIGLVLRAIPLRDYIAGELRPITRALLGGVVVLLLVACANVACLQLVRTTGRARELGVRLAMGAQGADLTRLVMLESLSLAVLGGLLGVGIGAVIMATTSHWAPAQFPQLLDARLNPAVVLVAMLVTLAASIAFGLVPAAHLRHLDPRRALAGSSRASVGVERHRFLRIAVTIQVALALALTMASALLARSLTRLVAVNPGFRAEHVLTANVALPRLSYPQPDQRLDLFDRVLARLRRTPGIGSAAVVSFLPFGGLEDSAPFSIVGRAAPRGGEEPHANYNIVSDDYFSAIQVPVLRGRVFTAADRRGALPTVVVDERLSQQYFPGEDPTGRHIQWGSTDYEIVGVVGTVAHSRLDEVPKATIYFSFREQTPLAAVLIVRGNFPAPSGEQQLRSAVIENDPHLPIFDVRALDERVEGSVGGRRLMTALMTAFCGFSVILAAVGLYGVLSYIVIERTQEIGIRAALGAVRVDIVRLILGRAARLAGVGLMIGIASFAVVRKILTALLYDAGEMDFVSLGTSAGIICLAVLIASALPAYRAARIGPATAMRAE